MILIVLLMSIFVNYYIVYDLGHHNIIRKILLNLYKSFGVNNLNYEPAVLDNGEIELNLFG